MGVFSGAPASVAQDRYNNALNRARDRFDAGLRGLDRNDDGALDERELAGTADRAALSERDRDGDRKVKPRELYARVSDVERRFDRSWRMTLGGRVVEMVHVGSTEAPEMSVIVFASERVVFASGVPPLTLQDGFGNYAPRDAQAWARKVDALAFDIMLTSDGRSISHADITAFSRYVATLLDVVADGHEAGRSAANLQASATLDAFRDTPFFAGRRAQIDAVVRRFALDQRRSLRCGDGPNYVAECVVLRQLRRMRSDHAGRRRDRRPTHDRVTVRRHR